MNTAPKPGDLIRIGGRSYVIGEIFSADFYGNPRHPAPDDGWFIEFRDASDLYHYWKQYIDGGELICK